MSNSYKLVILGFLILSVLQTLTQIDIEKQIFEKVIPLII